MKISNIDEVFQNYISRAPDYNIEDYMFLLELEHEDIAKEDYEALKAKFNEYIANRNTEKASEAKITNSTDVKKKNVGINIFWKYAMTIWKVIFSLKIGLLNVLPKCLRAFSAIYIN